MRHAPENVEPTAEAAGDAPSLGTRMARGTLAQQGSLAVAIVASLVTATALGRTLTLAEFGIYGFVVTLATYLYFAAGSAETAAVTAIAGATTPGEYEAAFSRSIVVFGAFGLIAGILIAAGGSLLVGAFSFPAELVHQARLGVLMVGALTAVGWMLKVFQDLQRATERFVAASISEAVGNTAAVVGVVVALVLDAPLWVIIGAGSSIAFYVGVAALVMVTVRRVPWSFRASAVRGADLRSFLGFSGAMFAVSASDLVINSMDRTVVAALRSASTLGLYEAASRVNTLIRQWTGTLSVTLLPVLSRTKAHGQADVERDLLLRGTKYVLAAVVGPTVVLMVLADRILAVWLGERFTDAAPAAVIFLALWLVAPNLTVANTVVVVERRMRQLLIYSWATAAVNLVLSVVLTALLGLVGVAIGTTAAYLLLMPYFVSFAFRGKDVTVADFARTVWRPVYGLALALGAALGALRLMTPLDHLPVVLGVTIVATLGYWGAFYALALDAGERALIRTVIGR